MDRCCDITRDATRDVVPSSDVIHGQVDIQSVMQEVGEGYDVLCEVTGLFRSAAQKLEAGSDILIEGYCDNTRDGAWDVVPSSDAGEHLTSTVISLIPNITQFQPKVVATDTSI